MRIALISDALYKWDGGIDFLSNIAIVLNEESKIHSDLELFLYIPKDAAWVKLIKKILLGRNATDDQRKVILLNVFKTINIPIEVVWYNKMPRQPFLRDSGKKLDKILKSNRIDIAFPIMIESYPNINTPWISYIPDLQEKHLPELFSKEELADRERLYKRIVKDAKYILTTSKSVKKDVNMYFPNKCKIYSTPFAPIATSQFAIENSCDMSKYHLPEKYFVVSNQFWAHKSHDTVFNAMEIIYKKGIRNVHLYCTGVMADYRGDAYQKRLNNLLQNLECKKYIHILGYIPKMEQVELIKNCNALVQPSLLEGDCGGCSVYLANSLCIDSILSDIEVNLEGCNDKKLHYFEVKNADSLANAMLDILKNRKKYPSQKEIENRMKKNVKILGDFYYTMLIDVINNYGKEEREE